MDKSINVMFIIVLLAIVGLFAAVFSSFHSIDQPSGAIVSEGKLNISDFPPRITAPDEFIGDAGDLVTIVASAFDPNGNTTTLTYGPPLNQSGLWQSTVNNSGIAYANITAFDGTQFAVHTVTIKLRPYCGDGNITAPEECDDGNNNNGDGCSASCTIEPAPPSGGGGGGTGAYTPPVVVPPEPVTPSVPPAVLPPAPRPNPTPTEPSPEPVIPISPEVPGEPSIDVTIPSYTYTEGDSTTITALDANGNTIPEAGVRVTYPDGRAAYFKTDPEGRLPVRFDDPGKYNIMIYKAGYRSKQFSVDVGESALEEAPVAISRTMKAAGIGVVTIMLILVGMLELFVIWEVKRTVLKGHVKHEITISNTSRVLKRKAKNIYLVVRTQDRLSSPKVTNHKGVKIKIHKKDDKITYSFIKNGKPFHLQSGDKLIVHFKVHGKTEPYIRVKHSSWLPWSRYAKRR